MREGLGLVALLACGSQQGPQPRLYQVPGGPVVVLQPESPPEQQVLPPLAVELATPGPDVKLTPPGDVDAQHFISAQDAWKRLVVDVAKSPATPRIPPALRRSGMYIWAAYRLCVNERGAVATLTQLKSADRLVDEDWRRAIRGWRFRPLTDDTGPKPFCSDVPVGVRVL
jgi:hypothetical protein